MSYETIIGLEIHAELKTNTKIFCNCSTKFGEKPNANTCPICLGLPGTLPVLNEEVIHLAVKAGDALNCKINTLNKMDRKNYFYPDLPKAYQISQFDLPICSGGYVEIETDEGTKKIRLNRIHIEEDAGKLVHMEYEPYTLIDYNRVGVPLIEIVSEPDMRSVEEAVTFLKTLRGILEYAEISDCRMDQGSLRCDANISLREVGSERLNTKVEIKNINSFKELQKALEKEEKRQRELYIYNEGYKVVQETRRWDSAKGRTISMRSKEDAHDYRYFPEPDIIPIVVKDEIIDRVKNERVELPKEKKIRFIKQYKIGEKEADIIVGNKALAKYFEELIENDCGAKIACNWVLGDILRVLKENKIRCDEFSVKPFEMSKLLNLVEEGKINTTAAKQTLEKMFATGKSADVLVKEMGLIQMNSKEELEPIIDELLEKNPDVVAQYAENDNKIVGYLLGQVMKVTEKRANPKLTRKILLEKLNE